MKERSLKATILMSFMAVIAVLGALTLLLGYYFIKKNVIDRAQNQVENDLKVARLFYNGQLETMRKEFAVIRYITNIEELRDRLELDYLYVVDRKDEASLCSEIAKRAFGGESIGGTRLIGKEELGSMGEGLFERSAITIQYTPKATPTERTAVEEALAFEYAKPIIAPDGAVESIICGGKLINRNFVLVDTIRSSVFEDKNFKGKPVGTVTIFLDDTRVATNVLDREGRRAIGTRVSSVVYDNVVGKGRSFIDRAFVVTDWYLTAYEPIRDISGRIIGILYVGILEEPFNVMRRNIFLMFAGIIAGVVVLAIVLSFILDEAITRPFTNLIEAAARFSGGDLGCRVERSSRLRELNHLARSFNDMAEKIHERDTSLMVSNEKLASLNKSYLDLVGFVSHELKGVLGSIVMNISSLQEGYLGPLNERQQRAVDSSVRSLDHFETMVKNYLDLTRIEKGEMEILKREIDILDDVVRPSIDNFEKQISEKRVKVEQTVPQGAKVPADKNLMLIVSNNLIGNALKYGRPGGQISVGARVDNGIVEMEFYNDGTPLEGEQPKDVFKKFYRLPGSEKIKGTGLGLFIVREIIEKHGGRIWVEPREQGNAFIFTLPKR